MCPSVRWSCLIISVTVGQHSFSSTWPETCFLCSVITAKDLRTSLNSKCVFIFKSFFLCVTSTGCVQVVLDFFLQWYGLILFLHFTLQAVLQLAVLPHSKKIMGFVSGGGGVFPCGVCLCLCAFPLWTDQWPHILDCHIPEIFILGNDQDYSYSTP